MSERSRPGAVQAAGLIVAIAVTSAAAAVGGLGSTAAPDFYAQLAKPAWAPPAWLFGPVWTVLYALMALAAWLVWRVPESNLRKQAIRLYVAQLIANALWSWLFFEWRLGAVAFAEVIILWALVLATTVSFWRVTRLAAWLLLPYLAWVGFAAALTFVLWQRNPALLG